MIEEMITKEQMKEVMNTVNYQGITAKQSRNNHVILSKEGRFVMHVNCDKRLNEDELKEMIDSYFDMRGGKYE